uniref:Sodium channel regulatory subunit beta-3 n=1 Tax=Scleropages formosus TaxID=113540 RepID=A0A8C9RFC9_SCLFO
MHLAVKKFLVSVALLVLAVQVSSPVCVDMPPNTEVVLGKPIKLTCISCMKREEVNAKTQVNWFYVTPDKERILIFKFDGLPQEPDTRWKGRLAWNGTKDLQDLSIRIISTTLNDSGTYLCNVYRQFKFDNYEPVFTLSKEITVQVKKQVSRDITSMYSEMTMYAVLIFLTLWLLVEMIYCYRKVSKADERVQSNVTDYLAIPTKHRSNKAVPGSH